MRYLLPLFFYVLTIPFGFSQAEEDPSPYAKTLRSMFWDLSKKETTHSDYIFESSKLIKKFEQCKDTSTRWADGMIFLLFLPEMYLERGNSKAILKDFRGALLDFDRAIELLPRGRAYLLRGAVKGNLGMREEACLDLSIAGEKGEKEAYKMIQKFCQ